MANPANRAEVAGLWGVREVAARPGRKAVEMFEAAAEGEIRALWIACTNPAQSLPDQALVRPAPQRCEFVVLQEAFLGTATADYAALLLPPARLAETDGTGTPRESRNPRRPRPAAPPGSPPHDMAARVP